MTWAHQLLQRVSALKATNDVRSIKKVNLEEFEARTLALIDPLFLAGRFNVVDFLRKYPFTFNSLKDLSREVG